MHSVAFPFNIPYWCYSKVIIPFHVSRIIKYAFYLLGLFLLSYIICKSCKSIQMLLGFFSCLELMRGKIKYGLMEVVFKNAFSQELNSNKKWFRFVWILTKAFKTVTLLFQFWYCWLLKFFIWYIISHASRLWSLITLLWKCITQYIGIYRYNCGNIESFQSWT